MLVPSIWQAGTRDFSQTRCSASSFVLPVGFPDSAWRKAWSSQRSSFDSSGSAQIARSIADSSADDLATVQEKLGPPSPSSADEAHCRDARAIQANKADRTAVRVVGHGIACAPEEPMSRLSPGFPQRVDRPLLASAYLRKPGRRSGRHREVSFAGSPGAACATAPASCAGGLRRRRRSARSTRSKTKRYAASSASAMTSLPCPVMSLCSSFRSLLSNVLW